MEDDYTERASERATSEKEGKRLGGLRALCRERARACLFIFASGLRTHYTRWIFSLARFSLSQAAAGKEEEEAKDGKETEEEEEETEERDAGREIRKELSSFVVLG